MKRIGEMVASLLLGLVVGHLVFFAAITALCFAWALFGPSPRKPSPETAPYFDELAVLQPGEKP